jgi:hypothetical protein
MPADETRLRALWARIPSGYCRGLCSASCNGPVDTAPLERTILARHGIDFPHPGQPDAWEQAMNGDDYRCPALDPSGRCGVYDDRPTGCRVWGTSELAPCPYGCAPAGGLWPAVRGLAVLFKGRMLAGGASAEHTREMLGRLATHDGAAVAETLSQAGRQAAARILDR